MWRRLAFVLVGIVTFGPFAAVPVGVYYFVRIINEEKALDREAAALPREEALTRQAGISLNTADLQAPLPPAALNAAVDYEMLRALLHARPIPDAAEESMYRLGMDAETPADKVAVRRLLDNRRDVMALIDAAACKPDCVFVRDWKQGSNVLLPEYAPLREAARLLKARANLLAAEGRYQEAVDVEARGLRLARHADSEPIMIPLLVADAIDQITLRGLDQILHRAGPNAALDDRVREIVATQSPDLDLNRALHGELLLEMVNYRIVRDGGMAGWSVLSGSQEPVSHDNSPGAVRTTRAIADAGMAIILREMRPAIRASVLPYPERSVVLKRLAKSYEAKLADPGRTDVAWALPSCLLPDVGASSIHEQRSIARQHVLEAAAAVLAYRARHGTYPSGLFQAKAVLADPFTCHPLQYRREGAGFVVYSVGETGRFNGIPAGKKSHREAFFRYP